MNSSTEVTTSKRIVSRQRSESNGKYDKFKCEPSGLPELRELTKISSVSSPFMAPTAAKKGMALAELRVRKQTLSANDGAKY